MRSWILITLALVGCEASTSSEVGSAPVPAAWRDVRDSANHVVHLKAAARCGDCHRDPDYKVVLLSACARCHTKHPEGIHAMDAITATSTARVGESGCPSCHAFRTASLAPTVPCLSCHSGPQKDRRAIQGHTEPTCLVCHGPHTSQVARPAPCLSCHTDRTVAHGASPQACDRCHGPHDPKGTALGACRPCHAKEEPVVTLTRSIPKHTTCTGCHQPHAVASGGLVACTSCHEKVAAQLGRPGAESDRLGHGCLGCHPPHTSPKNPVTPRPCLSCHTTLAPFAHAAKSACADCHVPHAVGLIPPRADCAGCHEQPHSAGHADCRQCHASATHAPKQGLQTCVDCHAPIQALAPKGHQACLSCHETHTKFRPDFACARCHGEESASAHGKVEGGCATCHGPHDGKSPPPCNSCHERAAIGGLHALAQHAPCASCHAPHQPPPRNRTTCLGCHEDKETHYPGAKTCIACHAFAPESARPFESGQVAEPPGP